MSKRQSKAPTPLDTLRLFQEKADELASSGFLKQLPNQEWSFHFDNTTGENDVRIVDVRPDDESRNLILTLRFF